MKPGNANGVAAVLLALLVLMGALAALPSWHASATQAKPILFGWVYEDTDASGTYNLPAEGLSGIRVRLDDISNGVADVANTLSIEGGYFQVEAPAPSYYEVIIQPDSNPFQDGKVYFTFTTGVLRLDFGQNQSLGDIPLETRVIDSTVSGTVRDSAGKVLAGASVTLIDPDMGYSNATTTATDGTYALDFYSGTYQIHVTHTGLSPHFATIDIVPHGKTGRLANPNVVLGSETIVADAVTLTSPGDYTIDYPTGEVSFTPALGPDAEVTASYNYTAQFSETLVLQSLGGEAQAVLAKADILNITVRNNGSVWSDYVLNAAAGIVTYNTPLPPQYNLTATYNHTVFWDNSTNIFDAIGGEAAFPLTLVGLSPYVLNEDLVYWNGTEYTPLVENASMGMPNYTIDRNTGIVSLSMWTLFPGDDIVGFYNHSAQIDYEYLTNTSRLSYPPIPPLVINRNGIPLTPTSEYNADLVTGEITVFVDLFNGDVLTADYDREYAVADEPVPLGGPTEYNVTLFQTVVWGRVFDAASGLGITKTIKAVLYDEDNNRTLSRVSAGPKFEIGTYNGNFTLVVDADGYAAYTLSGLTVAGSTVNLGNITLSLAEKETFTNTVSFVAENWNVIQLERAWSLNADSAVPGLENAGVSNLRLQIDSALGDGDGTLTTAEIDNFLTWFFDRGPRFVVTRDVLTVDNEYYRSDALTFAATFAPYADSAIDAGGRVWVNMTAIYNAVADPELDLEEYTLVVNGTYDSTGAVTKDYQYVFELPAQYELVGNTTNPTNVAVTGFTTVTVDPKTKPASAPDVPTATLDIQRRANGTARAKVVNGTFHPLNESFENYTVIVRGMENITFSAEDSTDPNSADGLVSPFANFTWRFRNNTNPSLIGYGIQATHNYTVGGNFTVNLTVTEAGGDVTYRDISVSVDVEDPVAAADITSGAEMDGTTFVVEEGASVEFSGANSTDTMFGTVPGLIGTWEWDWDGDGTVDGFGETATQIYSQPGEFNATLKVTDVVDHESQNATLSVRVKDVTEPQPEFVVLNETFAEVVQIIEGQTVYFNASDTTDNFDDITNLTFNWTFDDGEGMGPGQPGEFINVSHVYDEVNLEGYTVTLNVTDQAGNVGSVNVTLVVLIDPESRPNVRVLSTSFDAKPRTIEQGQTTTLSIQVENLEGRANASNVQLQFEFLSGGQTGNRVSLKTPADVQWFNATGVLPVNNSLAAGETKTAKITFSRDVIGNYTIYVNASVQGEWDGEWGDNTNDANPGWVRVIEPGYVRPLIYLAIILLIIAVPVLLWLRKKYQRGEIRFRRREKGEKPEKRAKPKVKK